MDAGHRHPFALFTFSFDKVDATVCRVFCDILLFKKPHVFSWMVTDAMPSSDALLAVPKRTLEEILRRLEELEKTIEEMLAELASKPETSVR